MEYRHRVRQRAMSEGQRQNRKNKLVAAIAVGKPIAVWARENKVSRRTAYRWAKDPKVKAAVDARRRKAVDHSIGVLSGRLARAANAIADLGKAAESESVRLSANKAVFSTMIIVSKFACWKSACTKSRRFSMLGLEARACGLRARNRFCGRGRAGRPRLLGLVRRIVPVRPGARRMPRIPEPVRASGRPRAIGESGDTWRGAGRARRGLAPAGSSTARPGVMRLGCLIAPTSADIRDVMVEGPSGLLAVAPPWCRPQFEPSKRRVTWPNGARAVCLSGEEPERVRRLNVDTLWADELACWQRAETTWDLAMLALRAGANPQAMITTTPRRIAVLRASSPRRPPSRRPIPLLRTKLICPSRSASRSSACTRIPSWDGRRSTPSFWIRPTVFGSAVRPGPARLGPGRLRPDLPRPLRDRLGAFASWQHGADVANTVPKWPSDIVGKAAQKSRLDSLTGCVHARFGAVQSLRHVAAHGLRPGHLPPDRRPPPGVRPVPARRRVGRQVI